MQIGSAGNTCPHDALTKHKYFLVCQLLFINKFLFTKGAILLGFTGISFFVKTVLFALLLCSFHLNCGFLTKSESRIGVTEPLGPGPALGLLILTDS